MLGPAQAGAGAPSPGGARGLTVLVLLLAVNSDQTRREGLAGSERAQQARQPTPGVDAPRQSDSTRMELRDPSFAIAVRGYERHAVDAYVQRVNRVIAELEAGSSPPAAVRQAMDRVGEQIGDVLQHARQAAEEITADALTEAQATAGKASAEAERITQDAELRAGEVRARSKQQADELLVRAREQAAELMLRAEEQAREVQEQAEPRLRELEADTQAVWDARRKLLEDLPRMATELMEIAGAATSRLRRPPGTGAPPVPPEQARPEGSHADVRPAAGATTVRSAETEPGSASARRG
jgi:cell division septum initiation protein DivIVA